MNINTTGNKPKLELYYKTRTLCPVCNQLVAGEVYPKENQIFIKRECPEHGFYEGLICSDKEWYDKLPFYYTESIKPNNPTGKDLDGCPEDCGLCVAHSQIAGTLAIEISNKCNNTCPTCLADNIGNFELSVEEVIKSVEAGLKNQDFLSTVALSGGEPTLHPNLFEILDALNRPEVGRIALNTNGLRILQDENFVKELSKHKKIYVSSHYDGKNAESLRGISHENQKKTLQILEDYNIDMVPVVLSAKGYNENELGTIIEDLFLGYSGVKSIMFSMMTYTGSEGSKFVNNPLTRLTIPEAIKCFETSTNGRIKKTDFIPLPMANPMCASIGYFIVMDNEITPLIQFGELEKVVEYIKNGHFGNLTPEFAEFIQTTIYEIFSNPDKYEHSEKLLSKLRRLLKALFPDDKELSHEDRVKLSEEHLRVVYLMQFMDSWSFDSKRLNRCSCQHAMPDGNIIPTCSFYCYHRELDERYLKD